MTKGGKMEYSLKDFPMELKKTVDIIGFTGVSIGIDKPTSRHYEWGSPLIEVSPGVYLEFSFDVEDGHCGPFYRFFDDVDTCLTVIPKDRGLQRYLASQVSHKDDDPSTEIGISVLRKLNFRDRTKMVGYKEFRNGQHSSLTIPYDKQAEIVKDLNHLKENDVSLPWLSYDMPWIAYTVLGNSQHRVSEHSRYKNIVLGEKGMFEKYKRMALRRLSEPSFRKRRFALSFI